MIRKISFFVTLTAILFFNLNANAQGIGINTTGSSADPSAMLDVSDTLRGVLVSRMTDDQRDNIQNPVNGLLIFNITTNCFNFYRNSAWYELCGDCIAPQSPVLGNNGPVCAGDTLKLTASTISGATYSWTGPNGFTSTSQNPYILNAQSANSGTYNCSVTVGTCTGSPVATVATVNALPVATFNYTPASIIVNQPDTFSPTLAGATYNWYFQSGTPATSTLQNPVVTWSSIGSYNVKLIVNNNGCIDSSTQQVNVAAAVTSKRAFLTSVKYNGNLGGLTGADDKCQTRANAAGLGGTWKAWLSDGSTGAASRLTHPTGQITAPNGTVIANDWNNLLAGGVHNLDINEFGNVVTTESGGSGISCSWAGGYFHFPWSNTTTSGGVYGTGYTCNNWTTTSSGVSGHVNMIYNVTTIWSDPWSEQCFSCDKLRPLMCFEQ